MDIYSLYFQDERENCAQFLTVDFNEYLTQMAQNGTYADHLCLILLQKRLGYNILVIRSDGGENFIGNQNDSNGTLVFGYLSDIRHYVSLEPDIQ